MAFLRYEERVRIERANGLRKPDPCDKSCHCSPYGNDDAEYKGKKFSDVASTPLRQNAVCPHPKIIVPVHSAIVVEEPVRTVTAAYKEQPYRFVNFNPCDGRVYGVLETVGTDKVVGMKHAHDVISIETATEDTVFDDPHHVTVVKTTVEEDADVEQPLKTGETEVNTQESNIDDGE